MFNRFNNRNQYVRDPVLPGIFFGYECSLSQLSITDIFPIALLKPIAAGNSYLLYWVICLLNVVPCGGRPIIAITTNIQIRSWICIHPCREAFGGVIWDGLPVMQVLKPTTLESGILSSSQNSDSSIVTTCWYHCLP